MDTATTITFQEVERNADSTFAYALLFKATSGYIGCAYRMTELARALDHMLSVLTPERIQVLSKEQADWLIQRLQELHQVLAEFSRSSQAQAISRLPFLSGLVQRLQNGTEDVGDLIDDLVLMNNEGFKKLLSDCTSSIGLSQ